MEPLIPLEMAKSPLRRAREPEPKSGDSEAVLAWKQHLRSEAGKEICKQPAAAGETAHAGLGSCRGLGQITVRGLAKAQCAALWCAGASNILPLATALLG